MSNNQRQKIEAEFYELAQCNPLDDEKLDRLDQLQKKYSRIMRKVCPKKHKVEMRFTVDTTEVDIFEAIEPEVSINPLREGYILKRVVEITEYHTQRPQPHNVYYINETVGLEKPKFEKSA